MLADGFSGAQIARELKISVRTVYRIKKGFTNNDVIVGITEDGFVRAHEGPAALEKSYEVNPPAKWRVGDLAPDVLECLKDPVKFIERYEKRPLWPHQKKWIRHLVDHDNSMILSAPRHGKTELASVMIPIWVLAGGGYPPEYYDNPDNPLRDQQVALVSKSEKQASKNFQAIANRLKLDQQLVRDFGRFYDDDLPWIRSDCALIVSGRQVTVLSGDFSLKVYGAKSGVLGFGANWIIVDDFADTKNCKTEEAAEEFYNWLATEIFSRLEPGGKIFVVGARLPLANDPYSRLEDLPDMDDDLVEEEVMYGGDYKRLFATVTAPAILDWNKRILLNPTRWSWKELMRRKSLQGEARFETVYQQRRYSGAFSTFKAEWIFGENGHRGCLDHARSVGQTAIPYLHPVTGKPVPSIRIMTVDPSPTKYAGAFVMDLPVYDAELYSPVLLDIHRAITPTQPMIDLMDRWHDEYAYDVLIVEENAAKFLVQTNDFRAFLARTNLTYIPHATTGQNKADPNYGKQTLAADVQDGRIRIPWADGETRFKFQVLVRELLEEITTDDLVMALWFPKWHLAGLHAKAGAPTVQWPGWGPDMGSPLSPPPRLMEMAV